MCIKKVDVTRLGDLVTVELPAIVAVKWVEELTCRPFYYTVLSLVVQCTVIGPVCVYVHLFVCL